MNTQLAMIEKVPFPAANDNLEALYGPDGKERTTVRKIVGSLGLDYATQYRKLRAAHWAGIVIMTMPDERGRPQGHATIPVDSLPMWMATINPRKVAPELRPKIELYQREAKQVLADWFLRKQGPAVAQPTSAVLSEGIILALVEVVSALRDITRELRADRVSTQPRAQISHEGYLTLREYVDSRDIRDCNGDALDSEAMQRAGGQVARLSGRLGYAVGHRTDPRYARQPGGGKVNLYHPAVLEVWREEFAFDSPTIRLNLPAPTRKARGRLSA